MKIKKLQLNREKIRELDHDELGRLGGAWIPSKPIPCVISEGGTCRLTFCGCTVTCTCTHCGTNPDVAC